MGIDSKNNIALSRIQKLIARRMLESKQTKPCFYVQLKADVTEMMSLRTILKRELKLRITANTFFVRAIGIAAQQYPLMIASINGDNLVIPHSVNVGFAVSAPQGLVVPVIRHANRISLAQIGECEKKLTDRARSNKLSLHDIESEYIATSNLAAYDIDSFIGIVPPNVTSILTIGNVHDKLVVSGAHFTVRRMSTLALAVDHRVVNGDYAAKFLRRVKELIESPQLLAQND
ncbi:MAG: 2-oxo acid dehydrogenase subunit E2 [Phycisphaerae bacterium]|nr:2-oxo acid dehydrogenase subunit E2 [Phycisphaerae bacterium]